MRSELVFAAAKQWTNRYLLMRVTSVVTRKLHRPHTRIQETTNDARMRLARSTNAASPDLEGSKTAPPLCCISHQKAA
jgi:hypothetical protein